MNHKLRNLLASAGQGGQWALVPNGQGLERSFKFKTFAKTWVSPVFFSARLHVGLYMAAREVAEPVLLWYR